MIGSVVNFLFPGCCEIYTCYFAFFRDSVTHTLTSLNSVPLHFENHAMVAEGG